MNKKGFTLIEIIVCLVLIVVIGSITTVSLVKNKNNNEIDKITQKIIDAANIYINIEKDENGNNYQYGILNGGKGVYLSLQTLVDKGYVDATYLDKIKETTGDTALQLLAVNAINTEDDIECKSNTLIEFNVSWDPDNDSKYLCPYDNEKQEENTLENYLKNLVANGSCPTDALITDPVLCTDKNNKYYFRGGKVYGKFSGEYKTLDGDVDNYIYFGKLKNTDTSILWRIIYMEDGKIKLALSKNNEQALINLDIDTKQTSGSIYPLAESDEYIYQQIKYETSENGEAKFNFVGGAECWSCLIDSDEDNNSFYWNDANEITIKMKKNEWSGTCNLLINGWKTKNYLYEYLYKPLKDWFDTTDLSNKVNEEKWNVYPDDEEISITSKFGLLTNKEYRYTSHSDKDFYFLFNEDTRVGNSFITKEITMDIGTGVRVVEEDDIASWNYNLVMRPSIVIDANKKVISGDGTLDNPLIVEE